MKQNKLNYSLVIHVVLLSLLLPSCDGFSNQATFGQETMDGALESNNQTSDNSMLVQEPIAQGGHIVVLDEKDSNAQADANVLGGKRKRIDNQEEKEKEKEEGGQSLTKKMKEDSSLTITLEDLPEELICYLMEFEGVRRACVRVNKQFYRIACAIHVNLKSKSELYKYISDRNNNQGYDIPRITFDYPLSNVEFSRFISVSSNFTVLHLKDCSKLNELYIASQLDHLRYLKLGKYKDMKISTLFSKCPSLVCLDLSGSESFSDLGIFSKLSNLTELNLSKNKGISNINLLSGFVKLVKLNLSGCTGIRNISGLSNLRNLTELNLSALDFSDNYICSLSHLSGLSELTKLYLRGCKLRSIDDLYSLYKLTYLDLSGCLNDKTNFFDFDQDISIIAGLTNLTFLNIARTYDETVACFPLSPKSRDLKPISLEPISHLTQLTFLSLSKKDAKANLNLLNQLPNLQIIYLHSDKQPKYRQLKGADMHKQLSKEVDEQW